MKKALLMLLSALSLSTFATEAQIGPIYVENVSVIGVAVVGHLAGNVEIKVRGGFSLPSGLSCDNNFITTLKTTDPGGRMFALLASAQSIQKPIYVVITDNPIYTAFPGRCSLVAVTLIP